MMNTFFKDMIAGAPIYALIKDDELKYCEGNIISVSSPRMNMPEMKPGQIQMPTMQQVVDVTYTLDGKNYTDAVDVTVSMFPTNNPGALSLVSTDKDCIVKELHATLKISENYIKETEREIPKQEKRISKCKELIALLDTDFKEKQQNEERFAKLEETQRTQGGKLDEILSLLKNKMLP